MSPGISRALVASGRRSLKPPGGVAEVGTSLNVRKSTNNVWSEQIRTCIGVGRALVWFNVIFYYKEGIVGVAGFSNIYESLTGADVSRGVQGGSNAPRRPPNRPLTLINRCIDIY